MTTDAATGKTLRLQEADIDGMRTTYERAGVGWPLIVLHGGFGFDRRSVARQIEELSDQFDVVAWDAPAADAPDPPERFGMGGYADCLAAFVGRLGLGVVPQREHSDTLSLDEWVAEVGEEPVAATV